jgi:magnesium chelatase family protein
LIGGGTAYLRPGEISLATNGVLFLDELAEFPATVLDALRQPLEEGVVRIARARATVTLPASILLVGAMNPCPCGETGAYSTCECSQAQLDRYTRRLSGPLLDRFDLHVSLHRLSTKDLFGTETCESSAVVAARVSVAREIALSRGVACNAAIPAHRLDELAPLDAKATALLRRRVSQSELTARGLDRVRRVARTIADLQQIEGAVPADAAATALELRAGRRALLGGRWVA